MAAPPSAEAPPRFTLYITNKNYSSWSLRIWLLMRRAGIPFDERLVPIIEGPSQPHFLAFSPTGRVPCLHDTQPPDGGEPLVVCESVAIAEYLAEAGTATTNTGTAAAGVWPTDARARAWARAAVSEMATSFTAVRELLSFNIGVRARLGADEPGPELRRDLARLDGLWREGLGRFGGPFLAGGEFGAVDAFYAPMALRLQTFGIVEAGLVSAEAAAYARRLLGLEEVVEWVAAAVGERWREGGHERDSIRDREVVVDYRAVAE